MSVRKEFEFLSNDKTTMIHARSWTPENKQYKAILQITHGMIEYIERYEEFAEFLTTHEIMVVAHDHIGHGDSVKTQDDWGFFATENPSDILIADMHKLREITQKENRDVPYFMLGHSMGSYLLRKYIALHGENLAGAIIMGTGSVPDKTIKPLFTIMKIIAKFHGWRYRSKFVTNLTFGAPFKKYDLIGKDVNNSWLTKEPSIVKKYYSDPKCTFMFTLNGYSALFETIMFDNQPQNIDKIPKQLPMFLVSGEDDPVGDCGKGVQIVFEQYKEAKIQDVSCKLYKNDRHEILNETDHQVVFHDILSWINVHIN